MDEAIKYLRQNELLHTDMIEALRHGLGSTVAQTSGGLLVQINNLYMMTAQSCEDAQRLCKDIPAMQVVFAHQTEYLPFLQEQYGLAPQMPCRQVALFAKKPLPPPQGVKIRPLGGEYLEEVAYYYSHNPGHGYLEDRFAAGVMVGAFVNGQLAGFAGEHEEGAMGMLEVLPPWRRQGVGTALIIHLINRYLAAGRVPHAQVHKDNLPSIKLQMALGFSVTDEELCWLEAPAQKSGGHNL